MKTLPGFLQTSPYSCLSKINHLYPIQPSIVNSKVSIVSYPSSRTIKRDAVLVVKPYRQRSSLKAVVGDAASAIPNDCAEEPISLFTQPDQAVVHETYNESNEEGDADCLDDSQMVKVCDKLIGVFMVDKPTPTDWRRLLAFSREWNNIRPHFFKRCQIKADAEDDPGLKHNLLRLGRKLKEIDGDVQRHNNLLEVVRAAADIKEVVAKRRKDFTKEFFVHLQTVTESYYEDPTKQAALAKLGTLCLDAVQAYDTASESIEALNVAELKFQDIVNSPSLDAACKKIDNLAEKNQLDSALVLMITKAWTAAKESNMAKDEVKDTLYHLYMTARGNLQRLMPKEIRILKYLLTIEDPELRISGLKDAFTPGDELEGKDVDCLYTTPEKLHTWISTIINAYNFSQEGTLIREARDLMNPTIIQRCEELKKLIQDKFM
ncbi:hypothetical protein MKW94_022865 [Papaver nudicaule]|uniref:Uncharacterized protein n=1 Tax=Papaver nudicaule TaxID=74823 RepID=A0AA41V9I8_PAPNU|nr:hypothetical protein [Papaver nudicaule]